MKLYESLQANTGQLFAGVGIPGTDIEVSRPAIPVAELHFDNKLLAITGTVALVGGTVATILHKNSMSEYADTINYPAGSDVRDRVRKSNKQDRFRDVGLGILLTLGVTAGIYDKAGPHTNEKKNEIDTMAVIVDAGFEGYAEDVTGKNGESSENRINATVNSFFQLELDGIDVTIIAGGTAPEAVGVISGSDGRSKVVENFTAYSEILSNQGTPKSGGGNMTTSLSLAEAINPDKILIFTGSMEGDDQSPVLRGQELPGENKVSIISVGDNGSVVKTLTAEYPAPINTALSELLVGEEDTYTAGSTDELKDVVSSIIDDQVQTDERHNVEVFGKIRNLSAVGLFGATALILGMKNRTVRRQNKKNRK